MNKMIKKFRVSLYEEIGGYATIEADNLQEAEERARQLLDDEGVRGFRDFDTTHRETTLLDIKEEKETT